MKRTTLSQILKGHGTEMFACDDQAFIVHDRQILESEQAPEHVKELILNFVKKSPRREKAYIKMAGIKPDAIVAQAIKCMFANLDGTPDIDPDGNIITYEYVACPKRGGGCEFEGIGCTKYHVINGQKISKGEMRVLELYPLEEKEIAEKLFISPATVKRHSQNMRIKTGIPTGKKLALLAFNQGVINQEQIWSY